MTAPDTRGRADDDLDLLHARSGPSEPFLCTHLYAFLSKGNDLLLWYVATQERCPIGAYLREALIRESQKKQHVAEHLSHPVRDDTHRRGRAPPRPHGTDPTT